MRAGAVLMGAVIAVGVVGCSSYGWVTVYNNTGGELIVHLQPKLLRPTSQARVRAGETRRFSYRDVGAQPLTVSGGGCVRRYDIPSPERQYLVDSDVDIMVQVQRDFSVVLLPPQSSRAVVKSPALVGLQRDGYPIRPVSKTCG